MNEDKERAEFEAFHLSECKRLGMYDADDITSEFERDSNGDYIYTTTECGWRAWKAARAAAPVAGLNVAEFARQAALEMEKHDFHGFEPIAFAVAEEVLRASGVAPVAVAVPEGWKLVPVVLTNDMHAAMMSAKGSLFDVYRATISAAPSAPVADTVSVPRELLGQMADSLTDSAAVVDASPYRISGASAVVHSLRQVSGQLRALLRDGEV